MAETIALEDHELQKLKDALFQRGVSDLSGCEFLKTKKGNLMCRQNGVDMLVLRPDGRTAAVCPSLKPAKKKKTKEMVREELYQKYLEDTQKINEDLKNIPELEARGLIRGFKVSPGSSARSASTAGTLHILTARGLQIAPVPVYATRGCKYSTYLKNVKKAIYGTPFQVTLPIDTRRKAAQCIWDSMQEAGVSLEENLAKYTKYREFFSYLDKMQGDDPWPIPERGISKITATLASDSVLKFKFLKVSLTYNAITDTMTCHDAGKLKRIAEAARKIGEQVQASADFLKEGGFPFSIAVGALKTEFRAKICRDKESSISLKNNGPFEPALRQWIIDEKEAYKVRIENERKEQERKQELARIAKEKAEEEKRKRIEETVRASDLIGDLAAIEIVWLVIINEDYITKTAVIQNLRGMAQTLHARVTSTDASGKFSCVPQTYIGERIDKLVKQGILTTRTLKGIYGSFEILKPTECSERFTSIPEEFPRPQSFEDFSEYDWAWYLQNRPEQEEANNDMLALLDKKGVICMYSELVSDFLKDKPTSWKEYAKLMFSMADRGTEKAYWKRIISLFSE